MCLINLKLKFNNVNEIYSFIYSLCLTFPKKQKKDSKLRNENIICYVYKPNPLILKVLRKNI